MYFLSRDTERWTTYNVLSWKPLCVAATETNTRMLFALSKRIRIRRAISSFSNYEGAEPSISLSVGINNQLTRRVSGLFNVHFFLFLLWTFCFFSS